MVTAAAVLRLNAQFRARACLGGAVAGAFYLPEHMYMNLCMLRVQEMKCSMSLRGFHIRRPQRRGGGGVKKYPKFADKQYIKFGQKGEGESKDPKNLRTSYMEAPLPQLIAFPVLTL